MAYIYRAKNGDATNEYRFPSAATANALALKFNLDPDPISVCSDAECRNDVGDISAIGAGTYYVDGRPHTAQGAAPTDLDQLIDRKVAEKMGEFMSRYSLAFSHIWTESVITELELGAPKKIQEGSDCRS